MPRREYSEETKAAVMAALLTGQSISHVAKEYKIPHGTVASWSRNLQRNHTLSKEKRERIGELIIDNVEAMLVTTKEMMHVVKNENWLRKQAASEVAVLFGVIADKTYRLLEALPDRDEEGA